MDDCDRFIKEISKLGVKPKDIELEDDRTDTRRYNEGTVYEVQRGIRIRLPFELKILNRIQSVLQRGKYNYIMHVSGDITYRHQLLLELSQEALKKLKGSSGDAGSFLKHENSGN